MVTLKEIAKAVGVSTATVSRVLNFDQTLSVTARKRQAIIETAEAMNYATPRARNRANQQGLSKVALVHFLRPEQEFIDPYYVGLRLGIESRCHALKIETVKVYHTDLMPEAPRRRVKERGIYGMAKVHGAAFGVSGCNRATAARAAVPAPVSGASAWQTSLAA